MLIARSSKFIKHNLTPQQSSRKGRYLNSRGCNPRFNTKGNSALTGPDKLYKRKPQVSPAAIQVWPLRGHSICDGDNVRTDSFRRHKGCRTDFYVQNTVAP